MFGKALSRYGLTPSRWSSPRRCNICAARSNRLWCTPLSDPADSTENTRPEHGHLRSCKLWIRSSYPVDNQIILDGASFDAFIWPLHDTLTLKTIPEFRGKPAMKPTDLKPPFDRSIAAQKVRMAENAWNTRDPEKVSLAYTEDSVWRNRSDHFQGRGAIVEFLTRKWQRELDYRLIKELWAFSDNRIGVRFQYEWHDEDGNWYRSYGNELWEFSDEGLMRRREASINDISIREVDRRFLWSAPGHRPEDHPGLIPTPE
mgnify:FL=1